MKTAWRAAGGLLLGAFLGILLTLALVVARAHVLRVFVHGLGDLVGPLGLPAVVLPLAGAGVGVLRPAALRRAAAGVPAGLCLGAALGAALGALIGAHRTHVWAGGVVASGVGAVAAAALAVWRGASRDHDGPGSTRDGSRRDRRAPGEAEVGRQRPGRDVSAGLVVLVATPLLAAASCDGEGSHGAEAARSAQPDGTPAAGQRIREVPTALRDTGRVESVVFLLGDTGEATVRHFPILRRVRRDVERWAAETPAAGEIGLAVLGDILYPAGLHAADHPRRAVDSVRLTDQIDLVSGPAAAASGARGWFLPGNHDWGRPQDFADAVRVERLDEFLRERRRGSGVPVTLEPGVGTGGPSVVDAGGHLRIVFLDTAWWLVEAGEEAKAGVLEGVEQAIRRAGDRRVMVAAHHPFAASGPHGGHRDPLDGFGVAFLLSRSGALLQDLASAPYRDLRQGLLRVFARAGRPAVFAGGHEHSLQVIGPTDPRAPLVSVVSGSASRLTPVRPTPASLFVRSAPGYARLLVLRDGTLRLELEAAPRRFRRCPGGEPEDAGGDGPGPAALDTFPPSADVAACLRRGARAFRTVWAGEIAPEPGADGRPPREAAPDGLPKERR